MDVQNYISSGIIESYVLGLTSPEESAEFERLSGAHGEIRAAREQFELQLETSMQQQKIEPPRELKSQIFSRIGMEKTDVAPPVIQMERPKLLPRIGLAKYVAAASIILLIGSVFLNFYLLDQYKKTIAQNKELVDAQLQIAEANQTLKTRLGTYENYISVMKNPLMEVVKMPGLPTSPGSLATIYWSTASRDVYLLVNKLPKPVSDKQYQLWAIVDGKPMDAGVFDVGDAVSFVKLKKIPKAEAFAVTLEKRGGSPTPTMDAMYVMGKVAG